MHVLPFVRVATKMNGEEERATLENFVDSSTYLELLFSETEDEKGIVHTIRLCNYFHPFLMQLSPNYTQKCGITYTNKQQS